MSGGPEVLDVLFAGGPVLLTGPEGPDGDSIGACLALQRVLRHHGVEVDVACTPAYRYRWLPGAHDMLPDEVVAARYATVVVLDGDRHRLTPGVLAAFQAASTRAIIDHHASTQPDGYDAWWVDPKATSTCEMLWNAFTARAEAIDDDTATLLYVGSIFDTGGFRYSNTTPATHRMAAAVLERGIDHADVCARVLLERSPAGLRLMGAIYNNACLRCDGQLLLAEVTLAMLDQHGAVDGDLEGIVDAMVFTVGVEVAVLVIQRSEERVKLSLRSRGRIDVAAVAQSLTSSGGGHRKAAGANLVATVSAASARAEAAVGLALRAAQPS